MSLELLTASAGLAAAYFLGAVYWKHRGTAERDVSAGRISLAGVSFSNRTIFQLLIVITLLLGVSGFLTMPMGYHILRDNLVLLHTIGGAIFILALIAFVAPRAAGMGTLVRARPAPADGNGSSPDRRKVIAFWGIVTLGLVLVGTTWAILSAGISQAAQGGLINLHSLAAFLFILMLAMFAKLMTKPT